MKILILGGTQFLGLHLVDACLAAGHTLSLFNRGSRPVTQRPQVEVFTGDRNNSQTLESVARGRHWDAVMDTCGYLPSQLNLSCQALGQATAHYTYVSSISAYAGFSRVGMDETAALGQLTAQQGLQVAALNPAELTGAASFGALYGPLKAQCEAAVASALPGRALVIRPGLIVGQHDFTDRFSYWVHRAAQGGHMLAPGRPGRPVQFIDAYDLARWIVRLVEQNVTGTFNAIGPNGGITMLGLLQSCLQAAEKAGLPGARLIWLTDEFLLANTAGPWSELPLWIPETDADRAGFLQIDCSKAINAGLHTRPIADTATEVLAYLQSRAPDAPLKAGMKADKEASLLAAWQANAP